jgi:prephenate dehydrogenase
MKQTVGIIGMGRFGKTLLRLLGGNFSLILFDTNPAALSGVPRSSRVLIARRPKEVYQKSATIFYALPISAFESALASHRRYFQKHLLIDVLSVKLHPARIFKKYLAGTESRSLLTHPLFGPDSSKSGFRGLSLVMDRSSALPNEVRFWENFFKKKGIRVVFMGPGEHDRFAANSQGLTHFVGRLLKAAEFRRTPIDTRGAELLHHVVDQTCNDSWELFENLQTYNPFTKAMRLALGRAYEDVYHRLLPRGVSAGVQVFGIQGGIGSFNHEAILDYFSRHRIPEEKTKIAFLYTTERVMRQLHRGDVNYGLFAIHNSVGGVVDESLQAIARYRFAIEEEFSIPVRHFLMKRKDVSPHSVTAIMAHPQALKQCRRTLAEKYPALKLSSGEGDLIDTARAAKDLAEGKVLSRIAILGPRNLSNIYGLDIIDEDLQDEAKNETSFLLVKRK